VYKGDTRTTKPGGDQEYELSEEVPGKQQGISAVEGMLQDDVITPEQFQILGDKEESLWMCVHNNRAFCH
jgi:hypothetical protein